MNWCMGAIWIAGLGVGALAIVSDLWRRSVPDWLTAAGVAAGALLHGVHSGWSGLGLAAAGAALGFALLLPFALKGAMGGGDIKLMAAFGAMLGPPGILLTGLLATIFGGLWAVAWLIWRPRARVVPFAPAIVLGAWASWLGGGT
jgi:prepilin peptidase CpaA